MNHALESLRSVGPLDAEAMTAAADHLDRLTKPRGSLGRLEELVVWLAGVTGRVDAPVDHPVVIVAAGDHGIAGAHRVSAYPSDVTAQMVANFLAGGAAISALAGVANADLMVLDAGVASPIPSFTTGARTRFIRARVANGTRDMTTGPAMTRDEAERAVEAGFDAAWEAIERGANVVATGEMGIGNTTAASAIIAAITGRPVREVTGRGTGLDDAGWGRKIALIERALETNRSRSEEPMEVLAAVGGLEIAALVGVIAAAAGRHVPVVLDGFITAAAALVACELNRALSPRLLAAHRSAEPGHGVVLEWLGLLPLLELGMRLGEGTGAALALLLLEAAAAFRDQMATFEAAGVSGGPPPAADGSRPVGEETRATLRR
jgi:nicotinate-nucleotide--dimethylbenzimidazole phosphoribosyltransferase